MAGLMTDQSNRLFKIYAWILVVIFSNLKSIRESQWVRNLLDDHFRDLARIVRIPVNHTGSLVTSPGPY